MSLQDLKFSEAEFSGQDVASLPDVPSEAGFTAAQLKARFDNVGKMLVALGKYNELIDALAARGLEEEGKISLESPSGACVTLDDTDRARRTTIGYQAGESYSFHVSDESYEDDGGTVMMFLHQKDPAYYEEVKESVPSLVLKADGLERDVLLVRGVAAPYADADAANKVYVDRAVEAVDLRAGGTVTGELTVVNDEDSETAAIELRSDMGNWSHLRLFHDADARAVLENCSEDYTDTTQIIIPEPSERWIRLNCEVGGEDYDVTLKGVADPVNDTDAANKKYVDDTVSSVNGSWYGECSTAAATAAKTVSCSGFTLKTGAQITVRFAAANTALNPTLNVNGTGAKPIQYKNAALNTSEKAGYLAANGVYTFCYDGSAYELVGLNGSYIATGASGAEVSDLTATDCYYVDQTADWGRRAVIGYSDGDSFSFHIGDRNENNDSHISLHLHQSAPVGGVPAMELSTYGLNADAVLVQGVADPVNDTDAVNKRYLEQRIREVLDSMASAAETCTLIITTNGSGASTFAELGDSEISITYVNGSGKTATATAADATLDEDGCEQIVLTVACGTQFTYTSPSCVYPEHYNGNYDPPEGLEMVDVIDGDDAFCATYNVTASAGATITLPLATNW